MDDRQMMSFDHCLQVILHRICNLTINDHKLTEQTFSSLITGNDILLTDETKRNKLGAFFWWGLGTGFF